MVIIATLYVSECNAFKIQESSDKKTVSVTDRAISQLKGLVCGIEPWVLGSPIGHLKNGVK